LSIFEVIEARRAVKHYDSNHRLTDAEFNQLMSSALLSPTSFNTQNWRFVRVTDPGLRQQLREAAWDQAQVTDSSELLVLCADLKAWEKQPERYWRNAPEEIQGILLPLIENFYQGKEQVQRDEAMRSCGIVAQTLMLSAKAMGYDSCPMVGFDTEAVANLIALPEQHVVVMMLAIGKADQPAQPRGGQLDMSEVLVENRF